MTAKTKFIEPEPDPQPQPVPKQVICSVCGLAWPEHGYTPTLATCVKLLKKELAKRPPMQSWTSPLPGSLSTSAFRAVSGDDPPLTTF